MKISEVTMEDIRLYARADDIPEEENLFRIISGAAKAFIQEQTGLTAEEMDEYEDLSIAYCMLAADYYDNRSCNLETARTTANPAVMAIINQHCRHIL